MVDRQQPARIVDQPEPCFVRMKIAGDRAWYAGRIFRVLGMLQAECNGVPCDPLAAWHGGDRISEAEYRSLLLTANSPKPF